MKRLLLVALLLTGCAHASADPYEPVAGYDRGWKTTYAWIRHAIHQCAAHGGDKLLMWSINQDGSATYLGTECHDGLMIEHGNEGAAGFVQVNSADTPQETDAQGRPTGGSWNDAVGGVDDVSGGAEYCVNYDPDNLCGKKR